MTTTTRRSMRFRPIHFVLSLLLAFAGLFAFAAPAQAATTGHISGFVGQDMSPLPLAPVAGLTAHLLLFGSSGFEDVAQDVTAVDGSYDFLVDDPADDGDYVVYVDGGTSWTDNGESLFGYLHDDGATGDVGPIYVEPAYSISGIVLGNGLPISDALVEVYVVGGGFVGDNLSLVNNLAGTEAGGLYTVKVPATSEDYEVYANGGPGWHEQAYDGVNDPGCGCGPPPGPLTAVSVTAGPVSGIDFDLLPYDAAFDLFAEQDDGAGGWDDIDGLTVVFEQLIGGTWTEVHRDVTDSNGQLFYQANLAGDFRLLFLDTGAHVRYLDSYRYPRGI